MRDRARFAEIASAAAVVISLIFVGLEVRESARQTELNTQSLQLSAYQDLIGQIGTINVLNIQNPKEGEPTSWEGLSFRESDLGATHRFDDGSINDGGNTIQPRCPDYDTYDRRLL